jgi:hypothetical protein
MADWQARRSPHWFVVVAAAAATGGRRMGALLRKSAMNWGLDWNSQASQGGVRVIVLASDSR